jgi:hypothetical protein
VYQEEEPVQPQPEFNSADKALLSFAIRPPASVETIYRTAQRVHWDWRLIDWDLSRFGAQLVELVLPRPVYDFASNKIANMYVKSTIEALGALTNLRKLTIRWNDAMNLYEEQLISALNKLHRLTELDMSATGGVLFRRVISSVTLPALETLYMCPYGAPIVPNKRCFPNLKTLVSNQFFFQYTQWSGPSHVAQAVSVMRPFMKDYCVASFGPEYTAVRGILLNPVLHVCLDGHVEAVELYHHQCRFQGMDLNLVSSGPEGRSAIGWCCMKSRNAGWEKAVSLLIQEGANVNIVYPDGHTPISLYGFAGSFFLFRFM